MLLPFFLSAQTLKGKVTNKSNLPLKGVTLYWLDTTLQTTTNKAGEFDISIPVGKEKKLIITFQGYQSDTLRISAETPLHIRLQAAKQLGEVVIEATQKGQYISTVDPLKTEVITPTELKKGACCDLAGCFNTNTSVQPSTTNVITNTQELRMLGLSGVYNQVLIDGFPLVQGLTYTYGISAVPGPLVENIYISKGANSVLQGFESISGQINVETKQPDKSGKLFLNAYLNTFWEKQANGYYAYQKNRWSNLVAVHTVQPSEKFDRDGDGFLDLPLLTRYVVINKLKFGNEQDFGFTFKSGIRLVNERRIGGQTNYDPINDKGTTAAYGQYVRYTQPDFWIKAAYRFDDTKRVVLFASTSFQQQNSWFGLTNYKARQAMMNTTLQYEWNYAEESNLKTGISFRFFDLHENITFSQNPLNHTYAGNYAKVEYIPGIFAENTLYFGQERFTWIAGVRVDYHNKFGTFVIPRTLLKYNPAEKTSIRASIGLGWRTANVFSENMNLLVSQRNVRFTESLQPERAVNMGLNFTQGFSLRNIEGTFSADAYRTQFQNQIFPDYNVSPTEAYLSNFTGISLSNGVQAEISLSFFKRVELKAAYNYLDVYRVIDGQKHALPFNATHRVLSTLSYKPLSNKWHFDANIHWYGVQQLPNTSSNPQEYQRPSVSQPYTIVNAQFTYTFKKIELYAGCENIFGFKQKQPIISWQSPFGPYFDVSSVWGPNRGREGYMGIRFKLE